MKRFLCLLLICAVIGCCLIALASCSLRSSSSSGSRSTPATTPETGTATGTGTSSAADEPGTDDPGNQGGIAVGEDKDEGFSDVHFFNTNP